MASKKASISADGILSRKDTTKIVVPIKGKAKGRENNDQSLSKRTMMVALPMHLAVEILMRREGRESAARRARVEKLNQKRKRKRRSHPGVRRRRVVRHPPAARGCLLSHSLSRRQEFTLWLQMRRSLQRCWCGASCHALLGATEAIKLSCSRSPSYSTIWCFSAADLC